jgi:Family of unknown function (DUF6292)
MPSRTTPPAHPDPFIDRLRGYITDAVSALADGSLQIERCWLDPAGPRDATIVYTRPGDDNPLALVWDEVSGWRHGGFESGQPGVRTVLSDVTYLGGGVLLDRAALAERLRAGTAGSRPEYRAVTDARDGFDDALAQWDGPG